MAARPQHPRATPPGPHGKTPSKPSGFKASRAIAITGIGVVSMLLVSSCSTSDYEEVGAECVDLNNRQPDGSYAIVDEDLCDDDRRYHGSRGAYGWYYGGVRSGSHIRQGTTVRPSDVQITSRKGTVIQRGGFGGRSGSGGGS
ncbi:hypothetical protein ABT352_18130 [Streptosporangium sp. NPDC000563]|uniref:hypothetical protein n=1 Tax=unclassified Streptosporangium TaxID=2632669 RepID=UPI003330C63F